MAAMQVWKNCGFATNATRSLQIHWSSPVRGEAHPRGSRSNSDAPWWDTRGTGESSLRRRTPKLPGSYNRIVREGGISFHDFGSKWEMTKGNGWMANIAPCRGHGYTPRQPIRG